MNITLSPAHAQLVRQRLERGEFDSADSLVAHALESMVTREAQDQAIRQEVREKIDRGVAQLARGEGLDGEQVFDELDAELDKMEKMSRTG